MSEGHMWALDMTAALIPSWSEAVCSTVARLTVTQRPALSRTSTDIAGPAGLLP